MIQLTLAFMMVVVVTIISSITITGSGRGTPGDDKHSNENEVFEEIVDFLKKWRKKSPSFRRNFPLSKIDQWSDHYPKKKAELIEGCADGKYWTLKLGQLLMDLNEEEE